MLPPPTTQPPPICTRFFSDDIIVLHHFDETRSNAVKLNSIFNVYDVYTYEIISRHSGIHLHIFYVYVYNTSVYMISLRSTGWNKKCRNLQTRSIHDYVYDMVCTIFFNALFRFLYTFLSFIRLCVEVDVFMYCI